MRIAIRQHLIGRCKSVTTWLPPYVADAQTKKPYGVISILEAMPAIGSTVGAFQEVRVWIYTEPGNFMGLDEAIREVRDLLANQQLTLDDGRRFRLEWLRTGRDFYDDELKANTKDLVFRVPRLQ
jgi:hypothetical protein